MPHTTDVTRRLVLEGVLGTTAIGIAAALRPTPGVAEPWFGDGGRLGDLGMKLTAEQRAAGASFLERHVSTDVHCHPGRFFLAHLTEQTDTTRGFGEPFVERSIEDLNAGNVSAALFSCISDVKITEMTTAGLHAVREFRSGEAFADYGRQLRELKSLSASSGLTRGSDPSDIARAHRQHKTAAVFAVEGGDFIEDRLDRIHDAFSSGVRAITIVHYHVNQIGDIQTQSAVHGGLTDLGKAIVREMNNAGIIVDLAHATFATTKGVLEVSSRPVMLSHSNVATPRVSHPRLISSEHAKAIAANGGIIGAWPAGIGQYTFSDYIESIQRLADIVGVEHVAIGTDMDANLRPVIRNYRDWGLIPAALLARGMHENEVAAIMGQNFSRVFEESVRRRG